MPTQPYEQLAAVCRRAGQDSAARTLAIARRADLREFRNLSSCSKAGKWLLDKTIKYGYQTWRAGVGIRGLPEGAPVLGYEFLRPGGRPRTRQADH